MKPKNLAHIQQEDKNVLKADDLPIGVPFRFEDNPSKESPDLTKTVSIRINIEDKDSAHIRAVWLSYPEYEEEAAAVVEEKNDWEYSPIGTVYYLTRTTKVRLLELVSPAIFRDNVSDAPTTD